MPLVATRYGSMTVPDVTGDLIGQYLLKYGEWAQNEVEFVAAQFPDAPLRVADIGAYLGTFGISLSRTRRLQNLVFVEANPIAAEALRANAVLAEAEAREVVGAVILPTSRRGDEVVGTMSAGNLGSLSFASARAEGQERIILDVPRFSLATFRDKHGPFDLFKFDIEGLEADVLRDDGTFLRETDAAFWLECNEDEGALNLLDVLLAAGLRVSYVGLPVHSPANFLGNPEEIFPQTFEAGLWASRKAPPTLPPGLQERGVFVTTIRQRDDLVEALWRTPRFGLPEWAGADRAALAALFGRELRGQRRETFLTDREKDTSVLRSTALREELRGYRVRLEEERRQTQEAQQQAQEAYQRALEEERRQAQEAYQSALDAQRAEAEEAARRIRGAEYLLWQAEEKLRGAEAELSMIKAEQIAQQTNLVALHRQFHTTQIRLAELENSTFWRITGPARRALEGSPRLRDYAHSFGRPVLHAARRILRRNSSHER